MSERERKEEEEEDGVDGGEEEEKKDKWNGKGRRKFTRDVLPFRLVSRRLEQCALPTLGFFPVDNHTHTPERESRAIVFRPIRSAFARAMSFDTNPTRKYCRSTTTRRDRRALPLCRARISSR